MVIGPRVKSAIGRGGIVENITYSNIVFKNILKSGIDVSMLYGSQQNLSGPLPTFRNINFYNITGSAMKQCGIFECLEQSPCFNIDLNHIDITCENGEFSC